MPCSGNCTYRWTGSVWSLYINSCEGGGGCICDVAPAEAGMYIDDEWLVDCIEGGTTTTSSTGGGTTTTSSTGGGTTTTSSTGGGTTSTSSTGGGTTSSSTTSSTTTTSSTPDCGPAYCAYICNGVGGWSLLIGTCATGIGCNCPAPPTETCYGNAIAYKGCIYGSTPTTTTIAGQCLGFCNYYWNGTGWTAGVNTCGTGCGCNNPPTDSGGYIGQNVVTGCSTNPSTSSTTSSSTTTSSSSTTTTTPCPGSCLYEYIGLTWVLISSDCSESCPCSNAPSGPPDSSLFISIACGSAANATTTSTTPNVCGAHMCRFVWQGSLTLGSWVSLTACPQPCICSYPSILPTVLDQIYESACIENIVQLNCAGACLYQWSGSAWSLISSMDCVAGCYCHPPQRAGTTAGEYASTVCSYFSTTTTAAPTTTTAAPATTTTTTGTGTTATTPVPTPTTPNTQYLCSRLGCCFTVEEYNVTYAKSDCNQGNCSCYPDWMIVDATIDPAFYASLYIAYRGIVSYEHRNKAYVYQSCELKAVFEWSATSTTTSSPPFDPQCGSITCQWQWHSANNTWTRYGGRGVQMNQYCRCEYPPVSGTVDNEIYSNPAVSASCGSCMQGADKFQWYFIGNDIADPFIRAPQELTVTFHDPNGVWSAIDGASLTLYRDHGNTKQKPNYYINPATGVITYYNTTEGYAALTYQTVKRTLGGNGGSAVKLPALNGTGNFIPIFDPRITADQRNWFVGKVTCPPCDASINMKKLLKATANFDELICKDIYFDFRATIALGRFIKATGAAGRSNYPCSNCFELSSTIQNRYSLYSQGLNTNEPTTSMLMDTGNLYADLYSQGSYGRSMEDLNFNQNYPFEEYPSAYQNLNAQRAHAKTTCTDCAYNTLEKAKFNVECYYGTYTGDNIPYVYDWQYNDAWTKETPIRKTCAIRFYNRYKDKMTQFPETREMHDFDSFSPIQMSGELQVKKLFWDISNTYINGWWGTSYYNQIMASILWDCGAAMDGVITYTITE